MNQHELIQKTWALTEAIEAAVVGAQDWAQASELTQARTPLVMQIGPEQSGRVARHHLQDSGEHRVDHGAGARRQRDAGRPMDRAQAAGRFSKPRGSELHLQRVGAFSGSFVPAFRFEAASWQPSDPFPLTLFQSHRNNRGSCGPAQAGIDGYLAALDAGDASHNSDNHRSVNPIIMTASLPFASVAELVDERLYVTQPHLPPLSEFLPYLEEIWSSKVLTNGRLFHQQLEKALCDYLGVKHLSLFANGTLALITALQAHLITGEVTTTPYSFVAIAHSLLWNGIKPAFVDIDPKTLNLDPKRIEEAITPQTTAIMPWHCYGHPCDVEAIQKIADNYNLKVIYDAAHAFGVQTGSSSVLQHGDMAVLSFHATKVFNTFESGAIIVCSDAKTKQRINYLKNFGFVDEITVVAPGINSKMSEVNAAFGLLQLQYIDDALASRKKNRREVTASFWPACRASAVSETQAKRLPTTPISRFLSIPRSR